MATATKKRAGIELAASDLKAALSAVSPAVPTRSPKPIYQAVRLGDGVLTGSDGEVRIDVTVDYHGDAILLPHGKNLTLCFGGGGLRLLIARLEFRNFSR